MGPSRRYPTAGLHVSSRRLHPWRWATSTATACRTWRWPSLPKDLKGSTCFLATAMGRSRLERSCSSASVLLDHMEGPPYPMALSWVVPGGTEPQAKRRPVMEKGTTYVALDDSELKLVAGILRPGVPEPELRDIPNDPRLVRRLFERLKREGPVTACYEAGVSGYDLYRQITHLGVPCQVIAPALTPRRPGARIKTDRRDAGKLVRLFRAGELTAIHVPDEAEEAVRDLVRCRDDIRRDVLRWRHRVLKLLARHGRAYLTGKTWSHAHCRWIRAQRFELPPLQRAFEATVFALEQALARQAELDKELEALAATAPYCEPVGWLRCFRGIDTLSAIILLAEVVDFQR